MTKTVIIFSGFNQRAVIAFIRTLEALMTNYVVIAGSAEDPIFSTAYRHRALVTRKRRALDYDDILNSIKEVQQKIGAESFLIAPSTEALNRFFLKHKADFKNIGCEIPLVNTALYESISDKLAFSKICNSYGIRVPEEYADHASLNLPCVAKPKKYTAADGSTHSPVLIYTEEDLDRFKKTYNLRDFYFQEYIEGDSLYLLYYFNKDGSFMKFSQENLIQQPEGKSILAAQSADFHNDTEAEKYEGLFRSIKFFGLVMIEVKRKKSDCYMIEANPRFWGPSQLFVDAKINLFEALLLDYDVITKTSELIQSLKPTKYFWYGGMVDAIKRHGNVVYHNYSKQQFDDEYNDWIAADVYSREDTEDLFKRELDYYA
jgi:predicted ATP-grasp superfamily ATP-dependent carboligase